MISFPLVYQFQAQSDPERWNKTRRIELKRIQIHELQRRKDYPLFINRLNRDFDLKRAIKLNKKKT